jgi:hypothetical protein
MRVRAQQLQQRQRTLSLRAWIASVWPSLPHTLPYVGAAVAPPV